MYCGIPPLAERKWLAPNNGSVSVSCQGTANKGSGPSPEYRIRDIWRQWCTTRWNRHALAIVVTALVSRPITVKLAQLLKE